MLRTLDSHGNNSAWSDITCVGKNSDGLWNVLKGSVQFSPVAQSCPTLCDTLDYNTPGFPVSHQLLELAQTHVTGGFHGKLRSV